MILIWRGWGIIVPVIGFLSFLMTQIMIDGVLGKGVYTAYTLPKLFACIPSSLAFWFIGRAVNGDSGNHSFFFIKIEYWAFVMPILMILIAFI